MTLEMTEKQRHRGLREMAEEFTMPHPMKDINERVARFYELEHRVKELEEVLDIVNQQRISAEATRFAALNIMEDSVANAVPISVAASDASGQWVAISSTSFARISAMVRAHRGDSELPR